MEPFESLTYVITQAVWRELHKFPSFLKHAEEDEVDHTYEAVYDAVQEALISRIGRLP